jgi:predicted amidohydrolase
MGLFLSRHLSCSTLLLWVWCGRCQGASYPEHIEHLPQAPFIGLVTANAPVPPLAGKNATQFQSATLAQFELDAQAAATGGAALVIFPELALVSTEWVSACINPHVLESVWCPVLAPSTSCGVRDGSLGSRLACMALDHNISVAVNLCANDGGANYNVEAIFSADGVLVASYRKSHPFFSNCFAKPAAADVIAFHVPYVSFEVGIFTCFDILFTTPSNLLYSRGIRHFVFSSSIPAVGAAIKEAWTLAHPNSFLWSSDSKAGQTGIFSGGQRLPSVVVGDGRVLLGAPSVPPNALSQQEGNGPTGG